MYRKLLFVNGDDIDNANSDDDDDDDLNDDDDDDDDDDVGDARDPTSRTLLAAPVLFWSPLKLATYVMLQFGLMKQIGFAKKSRDVCKTKCFCFRDK